MAARDRKETPDQLVAQAAQSILAQAGQSAEDSRNPYEGVGLGVDLVSIERVAAVITRSPAFVKRVYTEAEREYCNATAQPHIHFATRFAAKEAVVKALGCGFSGGIRPCHVEVVRSSKGAPRIVLHGPARVAADEQRVIDIPVSLSYTHADAVACALVITAQSVEAETQRRDPKQELAQQFKDARSLLDELPLSGPTIGSDQKFMDQSMRGDL